MSVRHTVPAGQVRKRSGNCCSLAFVVDYDKPNIDKTGLTNVGVETPVRNPSDSARMRIGCFISRL